MPTKHKTAKFKLNKEPVY